jgi:hypothetical protein
VPGDFAATRACHETARITRGFPATPPSSHTERACPQGQVDIHSRDSASIDFAQASGKTAIKNFWMDDIGSSYLFEARIRKPF